MLRKRECSQLFEASIYTHFTLVSLLIFLTYYNYSTENSNAASSQKNKVMDSRFYFQTEPIKITSHNKIFPVSSLNVV